MKILRGSKVCKNEKNKKQIKKIIATICWVIESES